MQYLGIPIKVVTYDAAGAPNYEQAVFGTVNRCPALGEALKAVARASVAEDAAARLAMLAQRDVLQAETAADVTAAAERATVAAEAAEAATQTYAAAIRSFVVAGFVAAGYTQEQAERYAELVGANRLGELKSACCVGIGRLDFSTAPQTAKT